MKKFIILALLPVMLLVGCTVHDEAESLVTTMETEPPGLYVDASEIELLTNGAVRQYDLIYPSHQWLKAMGDTLLLATDTHQAQLCALSGDRRVAVGFAQMEAECLDSCMALFNGFAYYDVPSCSVWYLDTQLNQLKNVPLPTDASFPVISDDGDEIFYYTGTEIRAYDTERNISRLVKTPSVKIQGLKGTCFDGKILICTTGETAENVKTLYISTENGQTLTTDNSIEALYTYNDNYLAVRNDGVITQRIVGMLNGEAKLLNVADTEIASALELGGAVGYSADDSGLHLNYYDLTSGQKSASVSIPGYSQVKDILADRWSGCVWLLTVDPKEGEDTLLRWDLKATPVLESTVYFQTLYTSQSPDAAGLDICQDRVDAINKAYGVRIRIWQEAVKYPGGHIMVPEHQTAAINGMLDALEPVLAEFPQKFLLKSVSSRIRICIVRTVDEATQSVHYWDENDPFIILPVGANVRDEFLRSVGYILDSHVLGNSAKYDNWNTLNPEGFTYGMVDAAYLSGDQRAFADEISMRSAPDDRSRILYEAMQNDNAEIFRSPTMQRKLLLICQAIRDAWNLERKTETYPWEQYLNEPIAYQK